MGPGFSDVSTHVVRTRMNLPRRRTRNSTFRYFGPFFRGRGRNPPKLTMNEFKEYGSKKKTYVWSILIQFNFNSFKLVLVLPTCG